MGKKEIEARIEYLERYQNDLNNAGLWDAAERLDPEVKELRKKLEKEAS